MWLYFYSFSCRILKRHIVKQQDVIKFIIFTTYQGQSYVNPFFHFFLWVYEGKEYTTISKFGVTILISVKVLVVLLFYFCIISGNTNIQKANNALGFCEMSFDLVNFLKCLGDSTVSTEWGLLGKSSYYKTFSFSHTAPPSLGGMGKAKTLSTDFWKIPTPSHQFFYTE